MKTAHQFMLVVTVSLLVAAVVLSPGHEEHAAMLAGEGRHKEAIALLERRLAGAPSDPDLLAALGRSYAALGEVGRAIEAFDAYFVVRPEDLAARKRQAELLLQMGWVDRYLDALARVAATQPSTQNVTLLIERFRLQGRFEEEMATLLAYRDSGILDAPQLERLGAMLAERGQWREARQSLDLADQKAPPDASAGRFLLLELLIRGRETDRVYDRAEAWMRAWRSPFLAGKLILRIAQAGLAAPASRLALRFTDIMPDDTFEIVDLLARKGHQDLAHQMLVQWADRTATPTGEQLRAFVQASALIGDVGAALVKLVQLAHSGANPDSQAEMAEEVANTFGKPALAAIRNLLPNEVLLARPLFAAELSLFEGNREMARWFLNGVEPAQLSAERSANWLALLHRVETDTEVFQRLTVLWSDGRLPAELLPYFADQATKLGQVGMHDLIWKSVRQ